MTNDDLVRQIQALGAFALIIDTGGGCEAISVLRGSVESLLVTSCDAQLPYNDDGEIGYGLLVVEYRGPLDEETIIFERTGGVEADIPKMMDAIQEWLANVE